MSGVKGVGIIFFRGYLAVAAYHWYNHGMTDSEATLAGQMIRYLQRGGWEIWEEYQPTTLGPVCDIVARRNGIVHALEVKKGMGFSVLGQAYNWLGMVHQVSCVTRILHRVNHTQKFLQRDVCDARGIGWYAVMLGGEVLTQVEPATADVECNWEFTKERKRDGIAGTKGGKHWTRFKQTTMNLLQHVMECPGNRITYAVKDIKHHYNSDKSARSALMRAVDEGIVPGVEGRREAGLTLLYPTDDAQEIMDVNLAAQREGTNQDR